MISNFYLVVNNKGAVKVAKKRPSTAFNEVVIDMSIKVPDALFKKPQLTATIQIPDSAVSAPVIPANVSDNIKDALEQQTGLTVRITAENIVLE